jgi:uncharacterized membrane protein YagU involved in acid resistance
MSADAIPGADNDGPLHNSPRAFDTIVYGGLAVGLLDITDAITFFGLRNHLTPIQVLQSVAGGLLGRDAFKGGLKIALLGLFLHFFIATTIATVYYCLSRVLTLLNRHAVLAGLIYGLAVYFVMTYIVVPHSAYGPRVSPIPLAVSLNGVIGHALLIGLPVALIARRSARIGTSRSSEVTA